MSNFLKDFDTLLDEMLTSYANLDSSPDTSEGSIVFIKCACLTSMLWGLYKYQDYIANQIFPDTMDSSNLDHYASTFSMTRNQGESDNDFLARILLNLRLPPAGGTQNDYLQWALSTPAITKNSTEVFDFSRVDTLHNYLHITQPFDSANYVPVTFTSTGLLPEPLIAGTTYYALGVGWAEPSSSLVRLYYDVLGATPVVLTSMGSGNISIIPSDTTLYTIAYANVQVPPVTTPGTVAIIIVPNDTTELANETMYTITQNCYTWVDSKRPVTATSTQVSAAELLLTNVTMAISPSTVNVTKVITDITNYMNTLIPGQTLYLSQLINIAIQDGAQNSIISTPTEDVLALVDEIIRPGTISVTYS
jgi:uncharacterized phage protein gp47/JayE